VTDAGVAAARAAAEAAGLAAARAAENASKSGARTSEFKVTIGALALAAAFGGVKALVAIPGPWQIPAAVIVGAAVAAGAYAQSRGKVKAAALASALPLVTAESGRVTAP
jgi:hypothetical protein